ncbi:MAG: tetratricopeptide repeat protein [Gemmatimonadales bacterium]
MQGSPRIEELRQKFHENPRRYFAPLANEYRKAGDPEQAIAICRAHLAQQPGHMSGHVVYGQALYDAKRTDEARVVFEKALSLDPDNSVVLRQLGDIARQRGETAEARHWYTRALDADPHDTEIAAYIAELTEPVTGEAAEPVIEKAPEPEAASSTDAAEAPMGEGDPPRSTPPEAAAVQQAEAAATPSPAADGFEESLEMMDAPAADFDSQPGVEEPVFEMDRASEAKDEPSAPNDEDDPAWRKIPPQEESPFVTRTMAELYARQGYHAAALDVYRQLALHHPDDKEIQSRVDELTDKLHESAEPAAAAPLEEAESSSEGAHFTELELSTGDTWDSDSWGAGFSPDETVGLEFDGPDEAAPEPIALDETVADEPVAEAPAAYEVPAEVEAPTEAETPSREAAEMLLDEAPLEEERPAAEEAGLPAEEAGPPAEEAEPPAEEAEPPEEEDEANLVAYSPQPPDDDDLRHFTPQSPTVREFFATLGAQRPPSRDGARSYTARSAVPSVESADSYAMSPDDDDAALAETFATQEPEPASDYPLAIDAFADLFPDSDVSEDDTRAAFALSGAVSGTQAPSEPSAPPVPRVTEDAAVGALPPSPDSTQESEEDIRRFREWLDGLADS